MWNMIHDFPKFKRSCITSTAHTYQTWKKSNHQKMWTKNIFCTQRRIIYITVLKKIYLHNSTGLYIFILYCWFKCFVYKIAKVVVLCASSMYITSVVPAPWKRIYHEKNEDLCARREEQKCSYQQPWFFLQNCSKNKKRTGD